MPTLKKSIIQSKYCKGEFSIQFTYFTSNKFKKERNYLSSIDILHNKLLNNFEFTDGKGQERDH